MTGTNSYIQDSGTGWNLIIVTGSQLTFSNVSEPTRIYGKNGARRHY